MRNSSTPPLLRLEDICVKFGFVEALKSVNLSIQRQEVIAIVGDNGAGKSTLIKVIAGFLQPGFGHIYLNGEQVTIPSIREADRMGIASVFQGQATTWTWPRTCSSARRSIRLAYAMTIR